MKRLSPMPTDPKPPKSVREAWNGARYNRALAGKPLTKNYTAPGIEPGGSPANGLIAGLVLATIVGALMAFGGISTTAIVIAVVACLAVGAYLGGEQRWVNEEHERREIAEERDDEVPIAELTRHQLVATMEGQIRLERKRRSQGRHDEADAAAELAAELCDELETRL